MDSWIERKPETKLMSAIFEVPYRDHDLNESVNGVSLTTALFTELEAVARRWRHWPAFSTRLISVLRLRFGFENGRCRTLEEVGQTHNVTRERIRQIENKALRCLHHPTRLKRLRPFLQ